MTKKEYVVGIVGVTGAVGEELLRILDERDFPVKRLVPLASARSAGDRIEFKNQKIKVLETTDSVFKDEGVEIAFFSAGGSVSERFAKSAVKAGAIVIDNTSFFRMQDSIPLVVPEVNPEDIKKDSTIIANPNCSTIQMVHVLAPLHKAFGIERVDVSTYQAVSGAGKKGMEELIMQMQKFFAFELDSVIPKAFQHRIALNLIPHIDTFLDNGFTKEEMKMINESQKIMHANFEISATCVRVPILRSHSETLSIRFKDEVNADKAREILKKAESVVVIDSPSDNEYPMPLIATDTDETFVGRIRVDNYDKRILHLFCVADQVRVGAATNAVRIAEKWIAL
ncbi:aspartate-semialdehyde dehydrogenase [Helicobacter bilis]|uniref:Aspartate-semialdehyde dehydrogenase n=1 Tax=Helicobacter bilis TaxID=37372 RepID=A0A4U8UBI9_9HELI|nr:aspartate-semialdehyde dehydrogenase [Helicobacter bilis]MCI7411094.1 aspartate-semialdehyde dehydrogenase [Helicobacter bilis]MDD7297013.1 aspartate-semialdehyde dehydrogenase [Helicobacter bilis]MDY4400897.1 aspartate-semialdehyde dehydrogenase [Helicobacter bilis]TLE09338.1 aspartate-semialdehyde dehydrogenase [Helicobacter bilis]TLE11395.1 aspartate-semialdehyde dehydrogenase [Helicobacter bilis]